MGTWLLFGPAATGVEFFGEDFDRHGVTRATDQRAAALEVITEEVALDDALSPGAAVGATILSVRADLGPERIGDLEAAHGASAGVAGGDLVLGELLGGGPGRAGQRDLVGGLFDEDVVIRHGL
jgi:hypothetical protein